MVAAFEDGSCAVLFHRYGKGIVFTIVLDAVNAAKIIPELVRDVIYYAVAVAHKTHTVEVLGTDENVDVAVRRISHGFRVAVVNPNPKPMEITLASSDVPASARPEWYDLISQKKIEAPKDTRSLKLRLPGRKFLCIEFRYVLPATSRLSRSVCQPR